MKHLNLGDTCILEIPKQKILEVIKLEKGTKGLVMKGINAGKIGNIDEVKPGTFVLPRRVTITFENRQIEIPSDLIMPVGKEKPAIQI